MNVTTTVAERHTVIVHRPGKPDAAIDAAGMSRHDLVQWARDVIANENADEVMDMVEAIVHARRDS